MIVFYCYHHIKSIVISNRHKEKIIKQYGNRYEILISFKDLSALPIKITSIQRQYPRYSIVDLIKIKKPRTLAHSKAISRGMIGMKRSLENIRRMSEVRKGRSYFAGQKHREESKKAIALKTMGNHRVKGLYWCYNPVTNQETRVPDRNRLPERLYRSEGARAGNSHAGERSLDGDDQDDDGEGIDRHVHPVGARGRRGARAVGRASRRTAGALPGGQGSHDALCRSIA